MNVKNILFILLRLVLGGTFLFSAYTKLYPVEMLELKLVETNLVSWYQAPIVARLFISVELLLGSFLILNITPKLTVKVTISVLIIFTFYLVYMILFHPDEDCGCFGVYIKLSSSASIIKNIILLLMCCILIYYQDNLGWKWKYARYFSYIILLLSLSLPYILNPVGLQQSENINNDMIGRKLDISLIGSLSMPLQLDERKKIVCFFSMHCRFCKLTAKKINIIENKTGKSLPVSFLFFGKPEDIENFWKESGTRNIPYKILSVENFFKLSGNSLPVVYFMNEGVVIKKMGFLDFSQEEVEQFLK